jgi:two-component system nitrogen regulation sensor histidine kinase NtrY
MGMIAPLGVAATSLVLVRRAKRQASEQAARVRESEELLAAIFDGVPPAVLMTETGRVVRTNARAREMFSEGAPFEGQNFLTLIGNAPPELREAMVAKDDTLFTVTSEGTEPETFLLSKRRVSLHSVPHVLVVVEQLTRELRRQEVEVWKKLLRTISHELNNSLAPISSMVHSAKLIANNPDHLPKLARVFDTIEDRTKHLHDFIEGYVHFARLPKPRLVPLDWPKLLERIRDLYPGIRVESGAKKKSKGDAAQLEQVLINLVKNAIEAGSSPEEVVLSTRDHDADGVELVLADRGGGMSKEVLAGALLPFYSTKERGTGLGLALCREIIEAHNGKIRIANREGGGLVVTCTLAQESPHTTRLTLTRG